jgi:hypothetical protein
MTRRRTSRFIMNAGIVVCTFLAGSWGLSARRNMLWSAGDGRLYGLSQGAAFFAWTYTPPPTSPSPFGSMPPLVLSFEIQPRGWIGGRPGAGVRWWIGEWKVGPVVRGAWVPLWMPLLPVGAATGLAWLGGRRARPGCCAGCGYDLRGLTGGVCPECGEATGAERSEVAP